MRLPLVLSAALVFGVGSPSAVPIQGASSALKVEPNRGNIAASRLDGRWLPIQELCERLGSKSPPTQLVFKSEKEPAFLGRVSAAMAKQLARFGSIYVAGAMKWGDEEHPFILTAANGNPNVFLFRAHGGDPLGDAESCHIALVPGQDAKNDLLFVGGDLIDEPFRAFQRAPETAK